MSASSALRSLIAAAYRSLLSLDVAGHRTIWRMPAGGLTLDSLLESLGPPNFVKIDIEGAELLALKGATRLLDEARPALYIEVGSTHATEVSRILTEARYRIFDSRQPLERQSPLARCVLDTLALPS
jgi:hypothetical protein